MSENKIKKWFNAIRPSAEKITYEAIKGYTVGCVFSIVSPDNKPMLKSMHDNGKNFAKMSAAYATTEILLDNFTKTDKTSKNLILGAVTGAVGSKKGKLPGSLVFSTYFGLSNYFSDSK